MKRKYLKLKRTESYLKLNSNNTKGIKYDLLILKFILSFIVLTSHNFNRKTTKNEYIINLTKNRKLHVTSFFIMSFYFMSEYFNSLEIKILLKRLIRLLIPYNYIK